MIESRYASAYSEVLEILKYIDLEDYNKIPKSQIELFEKYRNTRYVFKYDINKTLNEQNVSEIAKGILIILFRDFWANEKQREKIIEKQNYDTIKLEYEKYNYDNLFIKKKRYLAEKTTTNTSFMVEYKESALKRIINKIKNIFTKRKTKRRN